MALWAKVQQLPQEALSQVQSAYSNYFPLEVRHYFASWIEEQPWKDIDDTNPHHEQYANQLFAQIMELIEAKANDSTLEFLVRLNFQNVAKQFKDVYSNQPMNLVRIVRNCLVNEEDLVRTAESMSPLSMTSMQATLDDKTKQEIKCCMDLLDKRTNETDQDLRHMQLVQEKFVIDYQNQAKISANLTHVQQQPPSASRAEMETKLKQEKEEMDRQLLSSAQQILQQRLALASKHKDTLTTLETLAKQVVDDELIAWKQKQKLALNGASFDATMIDVLQKWCESLADLIWRNRMQIIKVDLLRQQLPIDVPQNVTDLQPDLNRLVTGLLSNLVTSTFIVEQQPPQVLKKDSRFTATVRLLVGGKLNLQLTPPRVKATIISEQQARSLLQNEDGRRHQKCGDILNNEGPMDYHQHSGQLSITFRNMSLKNIKRADRRGAEVHTVAEEKFCIFFSSDFNVGGNELKFQTLSLPVVVTVHGNQECQATATYLWDNQFSEPGRTPFQVPDKVPWSDLAKMLSTKFCAMTGRGLSDSNLKYLGNKLFGTSGTVDFSSAVVTWAQFNKENLPGRNFTFWEWFWSVGKLVKEHLKGPWTDGHIIGFMDKTESNDLLLSQPNGTFLLRFSDGTVGGITIAWVADQPDKPGERQVWNLAPFTIKDFAIRGLADRIKDLTSLVTLHPDIPKDTAFQRYYSPPTSDTTPSLVQGGYVKTTLINIIDGQVPTQPSGVVDFNNPQTPQAYAGPASPPSYPNQTVTARGDATMMDSVIEGGEVDFVGVASPEYANEDIDLNRINEWLSTQGNFQNDAMNT
ncbi:signal transducer and activator of transcription 5B-like isoform X3 [Mercenaria mercenaria]|uniref:signal transducer and activator of transcription 5B-like isoform X3 n=1 Tax=Mercenaria mercenaria TaxID=6596 RepID=UPI00234F9096|nr:signal transducer and activator of transcription 5B-like isoform X3 [Mercenaria mercenaria]